MPSSTPITKRYYPVLSDVITVDDLPEFLSFAEEGLGALLDSIHYKNLQYSKSYRGDAAFYKLDIVTGNIGVSLPFGFRFILNPDEDGNNAISSFPVTLEYQWEILAFLRSFNLQGFAFTPQAFYMLGLQIFRITEEELLAHILNYFVEPEDENTDKFEQLINDINAVYTSADLELPTGQTPTVASVTALINTELPDGVSGVMFAVYISNGDAEAIQANLQQFYNLILPQGIEEYIRQLIIPKAKASLTLSAGLEFPDTILKPVDAQYQVIPGAKTIFKFAEATLYVDTEEGISYNVELGGSLIPLYSQIGNTGLIISFDNARLDISQTANIPEADAAGYGPDFTGVYIRQASVLFNRFGNEDNAHTSAAIYGRDLLIGNGGISGTIGLASTGALYRKFGEYMIKNVIYNGDQSPKEILFRILVFKIFNKIQTWELLERELGTICWSEYSFVHYNIILHEALIARIPIYSGAYIMASGKSTFGFDRKHENHLKIIEQMISSNLADKIQNTKSLEFVYKLLLSYPTIGTFLAYQYTIDINYSELTNFNEMDFVIPGPGAKDGIKKCFKSVGSYSESDIIRYVTENQEKEFNRLGLEFKSLWSRPLQLIDCQNLFCETDKYARVAHPEIIGSLERKRIKQVYKQTHSHINYWYPPKWGINTMI